MKRPWPRCNACGDRTTQAQWGELMLWQNGEPVPTDDGDIGPLTLCSRCIERVLDLLYLTRVAATEIRASRPTHVEGNDGG